MTGTARRADGPFCLARSVKFDMRAATRPEDCLPHFAGIEAAINCVGVLQVNNADSTSDAHAVGPAITRTMGTG